MIAEYSGEVAAEPRVSYLTTDHLGSPRVVTDERGSVASRRDFTAFGEESFTAQRTQGLGYQPTEVRKNYTGYEKDEESGLEFAQARYYNPTHGRFTSVDPLTASATIRNPQTLNRYSYALNSPYKFTDPLGLLSQYTTGACGNYCPNSGPTSGYNDNYRAYGNSGNIIDEVVGRSPIFLVTSVRLKPRSNPPAPSVTLTHTTDKTYPVKAKSANDAATAAETNGTTPNGRAAETIFPIKNNVAVELSGKTVTATLVSGDPNNGGPIDVTMELTSVVVTAKIYVIYPAWSNIGKAKQTEQDKWNNIYLPALQKFEGEHIADASKSLSQFANSLQNISVTVSGNNLTDVAQKGFRLLKAEIQKTTDSLQTDLNSRAAARHVNNGHTLTLIP